MNKNLQNFIPTSQGQAAHQTRAVTRCPSAGAAWNLRRSPCPTEWSAVRAAVRHSSDWRRTAGCWHRPCGGRLTADVLARSQASPGCTARSARAAVVAQPSLSIRPALTQRSTKRKKPTDTIRSSVGFPWRRRESNPGPKVLHRGHYVCSRYLIHPLRRLPASPASGYSVFGFALLATDIKER